MINYLKMVNWRAYKEREIEFKSGITFLMGANGSGKTSILEAISYAFTGEAALFRGGERSNLLHNPNKPGIITLKFEVGDFEYEIMRTQNPGRAGDAHLIRKRDQKVLAQTHANVTKQIEKLLGISDDFLRRIIYMAEGDVFNFLSDPPKDALDNQIRSVLGLTQLNEFSKALTLSEKHFKARLKSLQDLSGDLIRLEVRSLNDLEGKLKGGQIAREQFLNHLDEIGREVGSLEQNLTMIQRFQREIESLTEYVNSAPDKWEGFANTAVLDYFEHLENYASEITSHHSEIMLYLARLDGQEEAYKRIISILKPHEGTDDIVPCPVCNKPITKLERKDILDEILQNVEGINRDRQSQIHDSDQVAQKSQIIQDQINQLQPLRGLLTQVELPGVHPSQPFSKITATISDLIRGQQSEKYTSLFKNRDMVKQRLNELDAYMSEYQAIKKRLLDSNFHSPEDLLNELVQIEVRMLSIRAASQTAEETLQSQQNTDMSIIYEQIADIWSSFRGDEGWGMEYNENGYPVMTRDEVTLDLRQLSGGEKTALLIMLHTIIAHHFSKSDFLMIDEPLEHLDPVNRRSLIKFLMDAYHHQIFDQAIIATFEESLLRKYQSNEGVNIILV